MFANVRSIMGSQLKFTCYSLWWHGASNYHLSCLGNT